MAKRPLAASDLHQLKSIGVVLPFGPGWLFPVKRAHKVGTSRTELHLWNVGQPPALAFPGFEGNQTQPMVHGGAVYFLSDRDKPSTKLFMGQPGQEPVEKLTFPEGAVFSAKLSPTGEHLAFLARPKALERTQAFIDRRKEEEASEPPLEYTDWPFKWDGEGYFGSASVALFVADLAAGKITLVQDVWQESSAAFAWSYDGASLFLAYDPTAKEELTKPHSSTLFQITLGSLEREEWPTPAGEIACLSPSPDGRSLAFLFEDRSTHPYGPVREFVGLMDLKSGQTKNLTAGTDLALRSHALSDCREAPETDFIWHEGALWFSLGEKGHVRLCSLDLASGELNRFGPDRGECYLTGLGSGFLAGTRCSPTSPPEACLWDATGKEIAKTDLHRALLEEVDILEPKEVQLGKLHAWYLHPNVTSPVPAIVEVHGGPMCMYTDSFFFEMQLLAAQGYGVFFSNPRGSTGYGQDWVRAILGNWGVEDWEDVETLADFAAQQPWVDSSRMGICGGSYGGFMVNWAIGHTDRYKRAITDRCVSNLISKFGNSDYLFVPDGNWPGTAFDRPEQLWESSPIKHFKNVKTPTLIVHSEGDLRCNIEQGEQVFAALKLLGVETKMIRYPANTSHGMSRGGPPDLRIHRLEAMLDWFSRL